MRLELLVEFFAQTHVREHPLQLRRVLEAAHVLQYYYLRPSRLAALHDKYWNVTARRAYLQFRDHTRLGVVAGRHLIDESFGEHLAVVLLKDVLVFDVLEYRHLNSFAQLSDRILRNLVSNIPTQGFNVLEKSDRKKTNQRLM